jgi:flagellar motility protein MotE (MotC chaperone)
MLTVTPPRLLPVAILAMGVMLATRLAELGGFGPSRLAPAAVQNAMHLIPAMLPPAQAADAPQPMSPSSMSPASLNPGAGGARAAARAASDTGAQSLLAPDSAAAPGPPPVSAAERQLLEDLRARRLTLEAREQEFAAREATLAAAERRLSQRVEELATMQARLEALDRAAREREEANWNNLVRIYENMRPREAARIFNELEMPVLLEVVARMKQRSAAPILAGMEPDRAQKLTTELAARQSRQGG